MANQSATFTVTVQPVTTPPTPLTLTPAGGSLPAETVGVPVNDPVTVVSGGVAPYTFAVSNGALPDGLSLQAETNPDGSENITIEGTPTTEGDFSFDLTVTDSEGSTATASVKRSIG